MKLISQADSMNEIFGKITPPIPISDNPFIALGSLLSLVIRLFLIIVGMLVGVYLLLGGLDWITSGGEKEKLQKAQNKITNAIIGLIIIFIILSVFGIVTGDILGIIIITPNGWQLKIPTL
jgi:hypothetical protein